MRMERLYHVGRPQDVLQVESASKLELASNLTPCSEAYGYH